MFKLNISIYSHCKKIISLRLSSWLRDLHDGDERAPNMEKRRETQSAKGDNEPTYPTTPVLST